eukprot:1654505-Heterocapsa_arctica.AAC.1
MMKVEIVNEKTENREKVTLTCIKSVKLEAEKINKNRRITDEKQNELGKTISIGSEHDGEAQFDNSQVGIDKRAKFLRLLRDKGNNKKSQKKGK